MWPKAIACDRTATSLNNVFFAGLRARYGGKWPMGATSYSDRLDLGQSRHDTHLDCVGLRLSTSPQNRMPRGRVIMPKNTVTGFAPCMGCTMYSERGTSYTVPSETRFTGHIESSCMDNCACLQAGREPGFHDG